MESRPNLAQEPCAAKSDGSPRLLGLPCSEFSMPSRTLLQIVELLIGVGRVCRRDGVDRCGIGAPALGVDPLDITHARQQPDHPEVLFVTPRLLVDAIELVALLRIFLLHRPRPRPRRRIAYRDDVLERVRAGAGPAFGEMQVLAGSAEFRPRAEVADVDNERVALPV